MSSSSCLVLFTDSFPYEVAKEYTFVDLEIKYLCSTFKRVFVVPGMIVGNKHTVPTGVQIEESYALAQQTMLRRLKIFWSAISSRLFWKELLSRPLTIIQLQALRSLISHVGNAKRMVKWVCNFIIRNNLDLNRTVFYTYWLDYKTLGLGLLKNRYPQLRLISRAHGYDLYEYRHNPPYIPCRSECLSRIDRLFLISEDGKNYISDRYPWIGPNCEVSRLGVRRPDFVSSCSKDGIFRVVSCSFMVPVKRLGLLLRAMEHLALFRPEERFEWHHIGDGPMKYHIMAEAKKMPANLICRFLGQLPNEEVIAFYKHNPIDVFVNVSEYEGLPVSIMEAESCGIPIIATAVGGTKEIVSDRNGYLLSRNPSPNEVAEAIWDICSNRERAAEKKKRSQLIWQDKYNADVNFQAFANRIRLLE